MRRFRGTLFLGAAIIVCGAWLAFYSQRKVERRHVTHDAVKLAPDILSRYVGDYELGGETYTITRRDGSLYVSTDGHPEIPQEELLAASATQFFLRGSDSNDDLTATQDSHGQVTGFIFNQGNTSRTVNKVR